MTVRSPGVAVVSPHLDDAVLGAWTVLRGGDAGVVNVFAGVPPPGVAGGWDAVFGARDGASLVAARREEDRRALAALGCAGVYLDLLESEYRRQSSPRALRAALRRALGAARLVVAPAGLGGHPDHVLARDAAFEVAADLGVPVRLYAELPYAAAFGWPPTVTGAETPGLDVLAYWHLFLATLSPAWRRFRHDVRRLDAAARTAKLECLRLYETQFAFLNGGPLGRLENPAILGYELLLDPT